VHTDFRRAFISGSTFWDPDRDMTLKVGVLRVGEISFPTGLVAISDPSFVDDRDCTVLRRRAPVGRWPAEVAVVRDAARAADGGGTVAAMRVRFGQQAAAKWAPAIPDDTGGALAIGVDAGRIAVFDRRVLERVTPDMFSAACFDTGSPASVMEFPRTSEVFVSDSGMGDGAYPAWWGMTESDELVEIVVDFSVLVRAPTWSISVPVDILRDLGPVLDPELAIAGVAMEVIDADDVKGQWTWDFSTFPEEGRPHYEPPAIGLALRVKGRIGRLTLLDGDDQPAGVNPAMIGAGDDGFRTEFWADDPRVAAARTLTLEMVGEIEPLGPPP
jgi:hypothetical protein